MLNKIALTPIAPPMGTKTIEERVKRNVQHFICPWVGDDDQLILDKCMAMATSIATEQRDADIKKAVKIVKELGLCTDGNIKQFVHRMAQE